MTFPVRTASARRRFRGEGRKQISSVGNGARRPGLQGRPWSPARRGTERSGDRFVGQDAENPPDDVHGGRICECPSPERQPAPSQQSGGRGQCRSGVQRARKANSRTMPRPAGVLRARATLCACPPPACVSECEHVRIYFCWCSKRQLCTLLARLSVSWAAAPGNPLAPRFGRHDRTQQRASLIIWPSSSRVFGQQSRGTSTAATVDPIKHGAKEKDGHRSR